MGTPVDNRDGLPEFSGDADPSMIGPVMFEEEDMERLAPRPSTTQPQIPLPGVAISKVATGVIFAAAVFFGVLTANQ
ncbi:MAG: hypothetical protein KF798_01015 [Candidatus Paracaedibacteraceae bacterium]|nr:hypothetical protein [Candidatus Paracaedibacteraceae bacterium]